MKLNVLKSSRARTEKVTDFIVFFRKKQQIVICVVAVMLLADFVLFGFLPLYKAKKSIKQRKAALRHAIIKGGTSSKQLPELKERLQKLQGTVSNFEVNVPTQRALGNFLQQIANLMTVHNLSEQVIVPGREIEANGLNCMPINMKCKGRLVQVFEFYKQLQRLDRLVRIEQSSLLNDNDFSGQVSMETKVVIYYRPEAESDERNMDDFEKI